MRQRHRHLPSTVSRLILAHSEGMTTTEEPLLFTVREAARRLGIERTLTYELIASNELPAVHIGRAVRIPAEAVAAFVSARLATTPQRTEQRDRQMIKKRTTKSGAVRYDVRLRDPNGDDGAR